MGTKQFNNYEDLLTFTRASKGHALRPVSYGDELVENGTFDTDSDWQKGTGWSISGGSLVATSVASFVASYQGVSFTAGKIYKVSYDVTEVTAGGVRLKFVGGTEATAPTRTVAGSYVDILVANAGNIQLYVQAANGGFTGSIDNVSVKEVTFDESDGTLTLFEHPNNIPRVEYDADGNRLGLLVEEARTNQFTYSVPDDTNWGTLNSSIDENQITAPDGTNTASNFIANSGSTISHFYLNTSITSGTTYTQSLFAKAKDTSWIQIAPSTGFSSGHQNFNLQTGSLGDSGNVTSASITDVGNGWYRCSVTVTATSTTSGRMVFGWIGGDDGRLDTDGSFTPDGTQGVYVWGAQLEEASFPTSYIKTTGSTATRSADVASIPVADFGYNQSAGTLFVEYIGTKDTFAGIAALQVDASSVTDRISLLQTSATSIESVVSNNNTTQSQQFESSAVAGQISKTAIAFETNRADSSFDGSVEATDTSVIVPDEIGVLRIAGYGSGNELNSHIKSIKYYPRALTSTQIQEITS